jgi:hypothetical protein
MGLTGKDKETARRKAAQLFPDLAKDRLNRKEDHNRAESLLLALWFARQEGVIRREDQNEEGE